MRLSAALTVTAAAIMIIMMIFTSCTPTVTDPLAYQDRAAVVKAELATGTGAFSVVITLDGAPRRESTITFTSPKTVAGMEVSIIGDVVTVSAGGMSLPVSPDAAKRWLGIIDLFRLDGGAVSSVTEDGKSVTVTVSVTDGGETDADDDTDTAGTVGIRFDNGSATPSAIWKGDGSINISVTEYRFTDIDTGTDSTTTSTVNEDTQ